MNGVIRERTIKNAKDNKGKVKTELKVYDVYYRYKEIETGIWKQTSKKGFRRKKDAEDFLVEIQGKLRDNSFIAPSNLTVEAYLKEWLKVYVEPNLTQTTVDGYKVNLEKHVIPKLGKVLMQELTSSNVQNFYNEKQKNGRLDGKGGLSAKSILYIHRVFVEAMEHAVKKRLIPRNIVKDANPPKGRKYKAQVYDKKEITQLIAAIKGTDIEVPVSIAVLCGLRRGEVLGLQWGDIDFDKKTITITRQFTPSSKGILLTTPKTEDSYRIITAPDILLSLLKKHKKNQTTETKVISINNSSFVNQTSTGEPMNPWYLDHKFRKVLKDNKLNHIRFHDLRHSCATLMLSAGVSLKVTSEVLGHSTISITADTYGHVLDDMKKDAASKVNSAILGEVNENK